MKLFRSNHPSCQSLHVWPIQKEHIVVQYSLDLLDPPPPLKQATLHPHLTLFRTLSGATAFSVCVGDKQP